MSKRNFRFLSLVVVCLFATFFWGQVSTSSIQGSVKDESGAVIAGAKVAATNEATGVDFETVTTAKGDYSLSALPPGNYTITISRDGFRTFSSIHNALLVGAPLVVDGALKVGTASEVITVESTAERIETTNAMISDVVTQREVVTLPLNGRNPLSLITLEPGLTQRTTNSVGSGTHVFGSRDRAHNVTIDGIDANESSVPNPQSNLYRLNPDNVQEFRVVTHNATAEFGRNSGANVAIATKSGTNDIHGDVFYFHRNTALNADEWFNKYNRVVDGNPFATKTDLKLHQYGADVGGRFIKDKTFWFFSFQGNNINQSIPIAQSYGTPVVYTSAARSGIFRFFVPDLKNPLVINGQTIVSNSRLLVDRNGNLLVPTCSATVTLNCVTSTNILALDAARSGPGIIDPAIASLLAKIPAPNDFGSVGDGLNTAGFSWSPPSHFAGPNVMGRVDHKFNENNNFFGRYLWADYDTTKGDFLNARPAVYPGFPPEGEVYRNQQNLALSYRHVFSPALVNEFTTGYSLFNFRFSLVESQMAQKVDPPPYAQDCFGGASFTNVSMPYCNTPHTQRVVSNIQFIDNLSWTKGNHNYKFGTNIRDYRHVDERGAPGGFNVSPTIFFANGTRGSGLSLTQCSTTVTTNCITSSDVGRFNQATVELLGIPSQVNQVFVGNMAKDFYTTDISHLHTIARQFDFYAQDEWKLLPNLTVNYGLRWEFNPPPTDAGSDLFVPDRFIIGSGPVNYVKSDQWYKRSNWNAFAPRIGFAWAPGNSSKTVVRAGYSTAFDTISTFQVTAMGGKVPGTVKQCKTTVGSTTPPAGCVTTVLPGSNLNNGRLTQVLNQLNPVALAIPTSPPSSQFSPPAQSQTNAPSVGAFDPNLHIPTVHEWSLTIQRELPWNTVVQVGYVGKHGTHLFRAYDINQVDTNQPGFRDAFIIARNNIRANCDADGTVAGISGTPCTSAVGNPALLRQLVGCPGTGECGNLNSSNFKTNFLQNSIGAAANRIDQNFFTNMVAAGFPANYFRPNPQFAQIFFQDANGGSIYHGAFLQLRRQYNKNLGFGATYTYSHSIDDMSVDPTGASSGGGLSTTNSRTPTDVRNFKLDRATSDFDNTHILSVDMILELPFGKGQRWANAAPGWLNQIVGGWTWTTIHNWQSGEPFTVQSGSFTTNGNHVGRVAIVGSKPSADLRIVPGIKGPVAFTAPSDFDANNCKQINNTQSAFCIPEPGDPGIGRNTFRGPGFWNTDMALYKNFKVTERVNTQFRVEFFNIFNHPNFENPRNATVGSPTLTSSVFGQTCCVTSALPSSATVIALGEPNRVIQLGLKVTF
jgi:hypothetical protein